MKSVFRMFILGILCVTSGLGVRAADESPSDTETLGKLKLGQKAEEVTSLIGKPDSQSEDTESVATNKWEQEWHFKKQGVKLKMASHDKGDVKSILSITAEAPCSLATARGIRIGSTLAEVTKAYPNVPDKDELKVENVYFGGEAIFTFTGGKVSQIFIVASYE